MEHVSSEPGRIARHRCAKNLPLRVTWFLFGPREGNAACIGSAGEKAVTALQHRALFSLARGFFLYRRRGFRLAKDALEIEDIDLAVGVCVAPWFVGRVVKDLSHNPLQVEHVDLPVPVGVAHNPRRDGNP